MVFAAGPHQYSAAAGQGQLAADSVHLANVLHRNYQTDAEGRVTLSPLVPGVTYWIATRGTVLREFTVRPGETLDLKDVTIRGGD
jgi:hypothetical protein